MSNNDNTRDRAGKLARIRVFILPTQDDIVAFRAGRKPLNLATYTFATEPELNAFKEGMEVLADEYDEVSSLTVDGASVTFVRADDDGEEESEAFDTPGEAIAYKAGIEASEGFRAPLLIEAGDEGFSNLADLVAATSGVVQQ